MTSATLCQNDYRHPVAASNVSKVKAPDPRLGCTILFVAIECVFCRTHTYDNTVEKNQIVPDRTKNASITIAIRIDSASDPTMLASGVQLARRNRGNVGMTTNIAHPITTKLTFGTDPPTNRG